jgi:hypothetical protein
LKRPLAGQSFVVKGGVKVDHWAAEELTT